MNEIAILEEFFKCRQVLLSRAWLASCINWCKEEILPGNYTIKDLQFSVFEQWLLLDLRDVEIPCLPPNLSNVTKYTLNGTYSLQVIQIVDISKPKHWQLQRIRNGIPKNLEQEAESSKRALLVTLSDGVQEVQAMEFRPIKCFSLNLSPGIKVRLMGPIDIRRGRMMLAEGNIKILGGEVDSLIVPNAAENVLAKYLKLPLNPQPKIIQESMLTADTTLLNQTGISRGESSRSAVNDISNQLHSNQVNGFPSASAPCTGAMRVTTQHPDIIEAVDFLEDEESRINNEIDVMMEVEREFEAGRSKCKNSDEDVFFDHMDIDGALENMNIPEILDEPPPAKQSKISWEMPKHAKNTLQEHDFFTDIDLDAHLDHIEQQSMPSTSSQMKIWTISELSKNIPNISHGKFKIKVKYQAVVEKMHVRDDTFHLVIKVTDGTGDIDVRLDTDVVAGFFGSSARGVMELKAEVIQGDALAQRKMVEGLRRLKDRLINLDSLAVVQVKSGEKFPVVLRLL